jgi:hypothetical protein
MRLQKDFTLTISGSSKSGKSRLILHLLKNADKCLSVLPTRIVICYGCEQPFYDEFKKLGFPVTLHKGVMTDDPPRGSMIIFDDLQHEADKILPYFIKLSHHLELSVVYITQNIFLKQNRNITLNSNYIILFSSWRDKKQISTLASQIDPNNSAWIAKSYKDATRKPYTYIVFDFSQNTPNEFRIRDSVISDDTHYYVDKNAYEYLDIRKILP